MKWPWSKTPHEKSRARWRKSYGDVPFPDEPMSREEAKAYLTEYLPCGCRTDWWRSPPSGTSCLYHIGGPNTSPPRYFIYARDVLDGAWEAREGR